MPYPNNNGLDYKCYGRIYVHNPDDVDKVHAIIKSMDESEYKGYMNKKLVAPFSEYPKVVYNGKFDIDVMKLLALCWREGIPIWVVDNGTEDWMKDLTKIIGTEE